MNEDVELCSGCTRDGVRLLKSKCPMHGPKPPMRLRAMSLPGDPPQFIIVIDRVPEDIYDSESGRDMMQQMGEGFREKLVGCGGILAFSEAVDLEAFYPYG